MAAVATIANQMRAVAIVARKVQPAALRRAVAASSHCLGVAHAPGCQADYTRAAEQDGVSMEDRGMHPPPHSGAGAGGGHGHSQGHAHAQGQGGSSKGHAAAGGGQRVLRAMGDLGPEGFSGPSADGFPGSTKSLWAALHKGEVPSFPKLSGNGGDYDVVVVGGGIVGLSSAYVLSDAGYRVALVEGSKLASGVTGFSTSKVTAQHSATYGLLTADNAKKYAHMNRAGMALVQHAVSTHEIDCNLRRRPHSLYTWSNAIVPLLRREHEAALEAGIDGATLVTQESAGKRGERPLPQFPGSMNIKAALTFPDQMQLNVYSYCLGLARAMAERHVAIFEDSRALGVDDGAPRVVRTADGHVSGKFVVMATHMPILDRSMHWSICPPTMEYVLAVRLQDGCPVPTDMAINLESPSRSLRAAGDDDILVVAGNSHSQGSPGVDDQRQHHADLEAWTRQHFPVKEVVARWMAMDYMSGDNRPYMGLLNNGQDTLLTATGFGKWGLSAGSASALVFRDHIRKAMPHPAGGPTRGSGLPVGLLRDVDVWSDYFDAARWDALSVKGVVQENVHTGMHFFGDKVKHMLSDKRIEDLQPGEGAVCKYKDSKVAAYRPADGGAPIACSAKCTHLGCDVLFNAADTTWDCPCHGSRFSVEGKVLHAPAVRDLERVEVQLGN